MPPKPTTTEHHVISSTDLGQLLEALDTLATTSWELIGPVQVIRHGHKNHYFATIRRTQ